MRVVRGRDRAKIQIQESYFLDHQIVLRFELCSRASCLEPSACGLILTEHLEFPALQQYVQSRKLKAEPHIFKDPKLEAFASC